jgi:hypothetical protein
MTASFRKIRRALLAPIRQVLVVCDVEPISRGIVCCLIASANTVDGCSYVACCDVHDECVSDVVCEDRVKAAPEEELLVRAKYDAVAAALGFGEFAGDFQSGSVDSADFAAALALLSGTET